MKTIYVKILQDIKAVNGLNKCLGENSILTKNEFQNILCLENDEYSGLLLDKK
jgi:hypothetical protein